MKPAFPCKTRYTVALEALEYRRHDLRRVLARQCSAEEVVGHARRIGRVVSNLGTSAKKIAQREVAE